MGWMQYVLDAAILIFIIGILIIIGFVKMNKYKKDAKSCLRAEIRQPTGYSKYFVIPCDLNAKTVTIEDFIYHLDTKRRRWDVYPSNPFLGLGFLQVPIRSESWYQDNPEPIREEYPEFIVTAAEQKAQTREIQAIAAAMQIQEIEARQKELIKAITNQPNKMAVYILLIIVTIASIANIIVTVRSGA